MQKQQQPTRCRNRLLGVDAEQDFLDHLVNESQALGTYDHDAHNPLIEEE